MTLQAVEPDDDSPFPEGASQPSSRTIAGAEYFIDTDPGAGNGTALDAEDLVYDETTEQLKELSVDLHGLDGGDRRVGVRVQDEQGNWSALSYINVYMKDLTTIVADDVGDAQVDRLTLAELPAVGTSLSVEIAGSAFTYEV